MCLEVYDPLEKWEGNLKSRVLPSLPRRNIHGGNVNNIHLLKEKGVQLLATADYYSYAANNLAVGLERLGIPVSGSIDHHNPTFSNFHFHEQPLDKGAGLLVVDILHRELDPKRPINVQGTGIPTCLLNMEDDVDLFTFVGDNTIFRAHSNRHIHYPYPHEPIAFGISEFLETHSKLHSSKYERAPEIIRNFRYSANQYVRKSLDMGFVPLLERFMTVNKKTDPHQSSREKFFEKLAKTFGCLAYGGNYVHREDEDASFRLSGNVPEEDIQKILDSKYKKDCVIARWDSWRFWESIAMGCLTFQLDFEKYGFDLPVLPKSWEHYIGIDLDNIEPTIERLEAEKERLPEIAKAGRDWALAHYSPVPTTIRLLQKMGFATDELETPG